MLLTLQDTTGKEGDRAQVGEILNVPLCLATDRGDSDDLKWLLA